MSKDCKDCRWSVCGRMSEERFRICVRDGVINGFTYCGTERDPKYARMGTCGPSGRYFKSRHTLVQRALRAFGVIR